MKFSELVWEAKTISRRYSQRLTTDGNDMCRVVHREHDDTYLVAYITGTDYLKNVHMRSKEVDLFYLTILLLDLEPLPDKVTTT